jgi:hypothetical protein
MPGNLRATLHAKLDRGAFGHDVRPKRSQHEGSRHCKLSDKMLVGHCRYGRFRSQGCCRLGCTGLPGEGMHGSHCPVPSCIHLGAGRVFGSAAEEPSHRALLQV